MSLQLYCNLLTDGTTRYDGTQTLKNMDDWLIFVETLEELEELEEKILNLMHFCRDKNLKLNPEKLLISEQVEFGGSIISTESVQDESIVFIGPKNKRVKAFESLKKPTNKKEMQIFCGMLASLQSWYPSLPLNIPNLRKATAGNAKFIWTDLLEQEYNSVRADGHPDTTVSIQSRKGTQTAN